MTTDVRGSYSRSLYAAGLSERTIDGHLETLDSFASIASGAGLARFESDVDEALLLGWIGDRDQRRED